MRNPFDCAVAVQPSAGTATRKPAQVEPGRGHTHLVHRRQERHAELPVLGHGIGEVHLGARPERVDEVGDERRRVPERHHLRVEQLGGVEQRPDVLKRQGTPFLDRVTLFSISVLRCSMGSWTGAARGDRSAGT